MTIQQVADELSKSTKTLRRWEKEGVLIPDKKEEVTRVRLYSPDHIRRWKRSLQLSRLLREQTKLIHTLNKELDKFNMEQDYVPGQPLKLFDDESANHYDRVYEKLSRTKKVYNWALKELLTYPKSMLLVSDDEEKENA